MDRMSDFVLEETLEINHNNNKDFIQNIKGSLLVVLLEKEFISKEEFDLSIQKLIR